MSTSRGALNKQHEMKVASCHFNSTCRISYESNPSIHTEIKMVVPFGVGVGDFIAVGKLIGKIITELHEVNTFMPLQSQSLSN